MMEGHRTPPLPLHLSPVLEALLRMGLAVLCGLAVGLNRARTATHHPNRVRVYVLVGLSACLMVLASGTDVDARSRAIQGVATGIGFLGAGEILVEKRGGRQAHPEVHGLTSAASIWFTAALGVTVAASTPLLAVSALVLALLTLSERASDGEPAVSGGAAEPTPAVSHRGNRNQNRKR